MYTPTETVRYEKAVSMLWNGPKWDKEIPLRVTIVLSETSFDIHVEPSGIDPCIRADADNCAKTILDALNGVAWEDDRQIQELRVMK